MLLTSLKQVAIVKNGCLKKKLLIQYNVSNSINITIVSIEDFFSFHLM